MRENKNPAKNHGGKDLEKWWICMLGRVFAKNRKQRNKDALKLEHKSFHLWTVHVAHVVIDCTVFLFMYYRNMSPHEGTKQTIITQIISKSETRWRNRFMTVCEKELKHDLTSHAGPARMMVLAAPSSPRWLIWKLWYVVCPELGSTFHSTPMWSWPNAVSIFAQSSFFQLLFANLMKMIWPNCMYTKIASRKISLIFPSSAASLLTLW